MARELDPFKVTSPRIFLLRILVFLALVVLVAVVLQREVKIAFMANPGLNGLIVERSGFIGIDSGHPPGDPPVPRGALGQFLPASPTRA